MNVVLDTNVLVSGIFFSGPPAKILAAWSDGRFELFASADMLVEYQRVVARLERQYPSVEAHLVLTVVLRECRLVESVSVPESACDDHDDLMFLGCALAAAPACIVSGDRALLRASGFEGVEVVTPAKFVKRHL